MRALVNPAQHGRQAALGLLARESFHCKLQKGFHPFVVITVVAENVLSAFFIPDGEAQPARWSASTRPALLQAKCSRPHLFHLGDKFYLVFRPAGHSYLVYARTEPTFTQNHAVYVTSNWTDC